MPAAFVLAWSLAVAWASLTAVVRAWRARARPVAASMSRARVLVVRPCAGDERYLEAALASSTYVSELAGEARVVFALAAGDDPARPAAERAARAVADRWSLTGGGPTGRDGEAAAWSGAARLSCAVVTTEARAVNQKSAQIARVVASNDDAEVIVVIDSDVELRPGDLPALLAPIAAREADAAWAPVVENARPETLGDRASQAVLGGSLHAFPLVGRLDPGGMVGKAFAVRAEALARVGGFDALTEVLGEDIELARRLRSHSMRVAMVRPFKSVAVGRGVGACVARYARWLHIVRAQRPALLASYPVFFLTTPLLIAAALVAWRSPVVALAAVVTALVTRIVVALAARSLAGRGGGLGAALVDIALGEALLSAALARALGRREVTWRGRVLRRTGGRWSLGRAAATSIVVSLAALVGCPSAWGRPKTGDYALNAAFEDPEGVHVELAAFVGKPILIVYESREASGQNRSLKARLAELAKGDKYRSRVALAAVADVGAYNYWPVKGFVKAAIRRESGKLGTTIFCDWDGAFRTTYGFTPGQSSVVLVDHKGVVRFSAEGVVDDEGGRRLIELLRAEVEGPEGLSSGRPRRTARRAPRRRAARSPSG